MLSTVVRQRKVKEPQKHSRTPKRHLQPPSGTQAGHPPSQEVISKTKPWPQPIPPKKSSTFYSDIEIHKFDENTATALLLGLARPVGDLEVPDLDDEHSQLGDEEESESGDGAEDNEEPETDEDIIDIPLHVPVNSVFDTLTMTSDISWNAFRRKIAKAMEISLEDLSIAYKFSTDAKTDSPHKLDSAYNLLQLLWDARQASLISSRSSSRYISQLLDKCPYEEEEILKDEKDTWLNEKLAAKPAQDSAFDIEVDANLHAPIVTKALSDECKESPINGLGGDATEDDADLEDKDTEWGRKFW
ncbi:hypothetical protein BD769DRAFT_1683721 [Suillus cothurnatus]|nr:hypothetical protein BD769DRAFT_1683721 [Suillus cothurnatus]